MMNNGSWRNNRANLMDGGVLAIGLGGALLARFRPRGLAYALTATGVAQLLARVIALIGGSGAKGASWPPDVVMFTTLWFIPARLFWQTAQA